MKFLRDHHLHTAGFNITPLIDILLVLIIFFILTWNVSRDEHELSIQVPTATQGADSKVYPGEVILNILPDGQVVLNGAKRDESELRNILLTMYASFAEELVVIIRADESVPYRHIIRVLDVCRSANVENVSFATREEES